MEQSEKELFKRTRYICPLICIVRRWRRRQRRPNNSNISLGRKDEPYDKSKINKISVLCIRFYRIRVHVWMRRYATTIFGSVTLAHYIGMHCICDNFCGHLLRICVIGTLIHSEIQSLDNKWFYQIVKKRERKTIHFGWFRLSTFTHTSFGCVIVMECLTKNTQKMNQLVIFAQQFECKIIFAVKFNATNKRVN